MDVFLDFEHHPLKFSHPESIIRCHSASGLINSFSEIEAALAKGYYVAGFVSYEAGYAFEERLDQNSVCSFPLLMMGVYKQPVRQRLPLKNTNDFQIKDFYLNVTPDTYSSHISAIRSQIALGNVYQITYCIKFHFSFTGDPLSLYAALSRQQSVPYSAYISAEGFKILSLSPERFLKKEAGFITTEPMKGTWPRGRTLINDIANRLRLWRDKKNRAENLMICDLLRNDLGRIGIEVRAPKIFTVARYRTLFQMTSTVTARVDPNIPLYDLFSALFPSGSVTGCPKIRAMGLIRELENEERRIYTGAIGYIAPNRDMYFNIPIRTILIEGAKAEMGVGGGIVWDSTAQGEWDEGMLKATFLTSL